jgi:hypothetical protein
MKKIKSPAQLESEKSRLEKKQADLESAIRRDWKELTKKTRPQGHIVNILSSSVDINILSGCAGLIN